MTSSPNRPSTGTPGSNTITARFRKDHHELEEHFQVAREALAQGVAPEAFTALDRIWIRMAVHIRAEHKGLFPILGSARPDLLGDLGMLRADHTFFMVALASTVRAMRGPAPDFPAANAALDAVERRLIPHDRLEEQGIYFMADQIPLDQRRRILEIVARELACLPERYEP